MKTNVNLFVRCLLFVILLICTAGATTPLSAQVFDPNDPVVVYDPNTPPTQPAFGQVGKWVKTTHVGWNTSSLKAYIYKGVAFRLKYPANYDPSGNTKYPLFLFFHGLGQWGSIYDNEVHLAVGAELLKNAVNNGQYNGFLLYPQSSHSSGGFLSTTRLYMKELIENFLVPQLNVDPFRVSVNGLSGGGNSAWHFAYTFPQLTAFTSPMSNASEAFTEPLIQNKFLPVWLFQGALDLNPLPSVSRQINAKARETGANFRYTEYPDLGHGVWNSVWDDPDYIPTLLRSHKANPWPLFGRTEFCKDQPINTIVGVSDGFSAYEWMKNGALIAGATTHTLAVTDTGTYSCRIRKDALWSPWSPIPVVIRYKTATIAPTVQVNGLASRVLPAPDGKTTVSLKVPADYVSYNWQKTGAPATLSTDYILNGAEADNSYRVQVTEPFGCTSAFTEAFTVINANGPNKPDAATNLIAVPLSYTSLQLSWNANPAAVNPQTGFEVYQATQSTGPYQFVSLVNGNVFNYTKQGLTPGKKYFYIVRAVNNTAAAKVSNEASATTQKDTEPPTTPGNLVVTTTTRTSVTLHWDESTDNVETEHYDIYINGIKSYASTQADFTVYNLTFGTTYNFTVKAVDVAGNQSSFSNQVTAQPLSKGLNYKYYQFAASLSKLPDYKTLTPVLTGIMPNVSIVNRPAAPLFGYLWEGYIRMPEGEANTGTYIFRTTSDDGSKLYLSPYDYNAPALVNSDGIHSIQNADASIYLTAGSVSPIAVAYYEWGGGAAMNIYWHTPSMPAGVFAPIPDSAFVDKAFPAGGTAPVKPGNLTAGAMAYNRVALTWSDNSNNETNFEIFRSTDSSGGFIAIAKVAANTTSYTDTLVKGATKYFYRIRAINQYGESDFELIPGGLRYAYYELALSLQRLPDFNILTPVKTGKTATIGLEQRIRPDNFGFKFEGAITLPATGNYTFYTTSDDGSRLYIDDINVVDNDGWHSALEASGAINLTAGVHNIMVTYYDDGGGEVLEVRYEGPGIPKQLIPAEVLGDISINALTPAAPPAPAAPGNLAATGISSSSIRLNWVNTATTATGIEVYRSYNDNQNYLLLATLSPATRVYLDTALYPGSLFYYKVRATGVSGPSDYTPEKSAQSLGIIPNITPVADVYMRYNSQLQVPIEATSAMPAAISIAVNNKPVFAQFDSIANGKARLTFNPAQADQGTYTITLLAKNAQGNTYTTQFKLTVNANYLPDITAIPPQSLNEKQTLTIPVSAADNDQADIISWSLGSNTASFVSISGNNRQATVNLAPGYSDAGIYNILVVANDGRNGKDTSSFALTVVNVPTGADDGTAPAKVNDLAGSFNTELNTVRLTWTNTAYNAVRNEVYRAIAVSGPYTLLNPGANNKDSTGFTDHTGKGNSTYFYSIKTVNNNGSNNSAIIQVNTPNRAPVINIADNIIVKALTTTSFNVVVSDDPGETVTTVVTGLPSFASFTPSGNGSGTLHLSPANAHPGVYNVIIKATDNYGRPASKTIKITVSSSFYSSTYINFTSAADPAAGGIWNDIKPALNASNATAAGFTVTNLKDEVGAPTNMNCVLVDIWPMLRTGTVTGNNSGIYPDEVLQKGYYFQARETVNNKVIRLTNLSNTKKYNLIFLGSRVSGAEHITSYSAGGQTVSLNSSNNTANTVRINGVSPAGNGQIDIVVAANAAQSKYAVINSLVVESYDPGIIAPPTNFRYIAGSKNAIKLGWENNTAQATGFEIWRSDAPNGVYTQLPGTIASSALNYTNTGLAAGTTYYYKLRSVLATGFSEFSDPLKAATSLYEVSINFNDGSPVGPAMPFPWNNPNELIYEGFVLPNMVNDNSQPTGMNMTAVTSLNLFSGTSRADNTLSTGNNSGVVPDIVMSTFYFMEYTQVGKIKIDGLNNAMRYNFVFFADCKDRGRGQITTYSIGDNQVQLDARNNTLNTVQINNVKPDELGSVLISLTASVQGGFGYIGALIIQAVPSDEAGPSSARKGDANAGTTAQRTVIALGNETQDERANIIVGAYPNPVVDDITLRCSLKRPEPRAVVVVRDMLGKPVFSKTLNNLPAGQSNQKIGINGRRLVPGLYSIQLELLSNNERASIIVVK